MGRQPYKQVTQYIETIAFISTVKFAEGGFFWSQRCISHKVRWAVQKCRFRA